MFSIHIVLIFHVYFEKISVLSSDLFLFYIAKLGSVCSVTLQRSWRNNGGSTGRRRLLQADMTAIYGDGSVEVPNPIICLENNELIIFRIWIDETDRQYSHYPKYVKDHLLNSNTKFDYGDFTMLEYYILQTNVSYNAFAYQFGDGGVYVFKDSQNRNT